MECILAKPNRCLINVTTSLVNYRIYVSIYPSDKGNILRIAREFINMAQFMESMENDAILFFFLVEKKYIRLIDHGKSFCTRRDMSSTQVAWFQAIHANHSHPLLS